MMDWTIATWSRAISRSEILKNGVEEDVAQLPPEEKKNLPN